MKNIGNSAYGRTSMNKSKHANISYETLDEAKKSINTPYFKDCDRYGDVYGVQKRKKTQSRICLFNCRLLYYHMQS